MCDLCHGEWIVFALAPDERLVVLTKIEAKATHDRVIASLLNAASDKQRRHGAVPEREAPLCSKPCAIRAKEVAVTDGEPEIIDWVV